MVGELADSRDSGWKAVAACTCQRIKFRALHRYNKLKYQLGTLPN